MPHLFCRNVKQLIGELEDQEGDIAKALAEAQKVGICLDADGTFAMLPDISKELKVHRGRSLSSPTPENAFLFPVSAS